MKSRNAVLITFATTLGLLASVSAFNYKIDPLCYYHCDQIDLDRNTMNTYFTVAQIIAAHPESELAMVGSSRGQTTPILWVQKKTGLKSLNLSIAGAEVEAKTAFLNMALEKDHLKRVIWFTDFFEFSPAVVDPKVKNTPLLRRYLPEVDSTNSMIKSLINHNTFEAAIYALKKRPRQDIDQGSGTGANYALCESPLYKGSRPYSEVLKDINLGFDANDRKILSYPHSETHWNLFQNELEKLSQNSVRVDLVIIPYNPLFLQKLKTQTPELFERHLKWIERLQKLNSNHVHVHNFFWGLPGDDGSELFWEDGVHFTCRGAMFLLKKIL